MTITTPTPIDPLPTPPSTSDPTTFETRADAFIAALPGLQGQTNALGTNVYNNATEAALAAAEADAAAAGAAASEANAIAQAAAAAGSASTAAGFVSTSTTSMTIGSGAKTCTIGLNKSFAAGGGDFILVADASAPTTNYMVGQTTSYTAATGALAFTVAANGFAGSGTKTSWTVQLSGQQGAAGGSAFTGGSLTTPVNYAPEATVASAATCAIFGASSNYVQVTGTVTITAFDTVASGAMRIVEFAGALTLTHNATSLILPGAANITTAAGDVAIFVSEGSGNARCVGYVRAARSPDAGGAPDVIVEDQKTSGTAGQSGIGNGSWTTRNLNTLVRNVAGAALASNQVTLLAGTYAFRATTSVRGAAGSAGVARTRLYNVTDAAAVKEGVQVGFAGSTTDSQAGGCAPPVSGVFTLAASKALRLETYQNSGGTADGGGALSTGSVEIYSTLEFWKVG